MKLTNRSTPSTAFVPLAALLIAGCGENKFEKEVEKETAAVTLAREAELGGYGLITTAELKKLIDEKTAMLIVDAMPAESYGKEHVPGAVNFLFPIPEMTEWDAKETGGATRDRFVEILGPDKSRLLVFYCGFVKCTRSHNGAMWAVKEGYTSVKRYPGGIYAWKGAGHATEGGE